MAWWRPATFRKYFLYMWMQDWASQHGHNQRMKPSSKKFYNTVLEGLDLPVKPVKRDGYDCFEFTPKTVHEHIAERRWIEDDGSAGGGGGGLRRRRRRRRRRGPRRQGVHRRDVRLTEVGSVVPEHGFPLGLLGPLRPLWRPRWWVWFKRALIDNIIKIKNYLLLGIRNVRGE